MRKAIIFFSIIIVFAVFVVSGLHKERNSKEKSLLGMKEFFMMHKGIERRYLVYAPKGYDVQRPLPVVLNFHGGGGNADGMEPMAHMSATADAHNFIVVYPEATGTKFLGTLIGAWNTGLDERFAHVDDVGFISALINVLKKDFSVDDARIYATGISNGAQMVYRLACERSDLITAIAPVGSQSVTGACSLKRPVPVIHFHGTEDKCAFYNGGVCGGCIADYFKGLTGITVKTVEHQCESVPDAFRKVIAMNGIQNKAPVVVYKNNNAECTAYGQEEAGESVLCVVKGMGHTWPGGGYGKPCEDGYETKKCKEYVNVVGALSNDISANEMIWEFFSKFSLKK